MSDPGETIQLWQAPFFDPAPVPASGMPVAELQALAQAQGFQAGKEEGLAAGKAQAEEMVGRMTALADEFAVPFRGLDTVVTRELAQMAMLLAGHIIRRELAIDSTVVTDMVAQAMQTLYTLEGEIIVFLNPEDVELVRQHAPESLDGKAWKIVEDERLQKGGCQVKTPTSFVDASVENQMEELFSRLLDSCENEFES